MANTLRIKRRSLSGAAGVDGLTLQNAELAFNEADNTLYYGTGTAGAGGTATSIIAIAGYGAYATLGTEQTITGNKTFSGTIFVPTPTANTHAATKIYVDTAVSGMSTFAVAGDSGANQTITNGVDTLTISGGTAITSVAGSTDTVTLNLDNTAVVAGTYGSASLVPTFTVDAQGRLTSAGTESIATVLNLNGDTGGVAISLLTEELNILGGTGLTSIAAPSTDTITISLDNTAVESGSYGNTNHIPSFTVDAQGRLTAASTSAVLIDLGTNTNGNYVASVATGNGLSVSNTGVEGGIFTLVNEGVLSVTGTSNEVSVSTSNGAVTVSLPSNVTISNNLVVTGDLTVNGNTTTLNTSTLVVEDKNIVLSNTSEPSDITADGAGITIIGATDKTFNWVDATDSWTASEHLDLAAGKVFKIGTSEILSNTTLGSTVVTSSLTSVGTIISGAWNGSTISISHGGTGATTASNARINLGLEIGVNVQGYDIELAALAGLTSSADKLPFFTGSGTAALATLTSYGRDIIASVDASATRTTLGLGTIAVQNSSSVTITGGSITNLSTFDGVTIDGGTF